MSLLDCFMGFFSISNHVQTLLVGLTDEVKGLLDGAPCPL